MAGARRPRAVVALLVGVPGALGISACRSGDLSDPTPEPFLTQAVESRLREGDIPDHGVLPDSGMLFVVPDRTWETHGDVLTPDLLPTVPGRPLVLATRDSLAELARERGERVVFMTVGRPFTEGGHTLVRLGADYVEPRASPVGKLCCCSGDARFIRDGDRYVFRRLAQRDLRVTAGGGRLRIRQTRGS
jgi:hypothetical protein